jgi:hypothetical protein
MLNHCYYIATVDLNLLSSQLLIYKFHYFDFPRLPCCAFFLFHFLCVLININASVSCCWFQSVFTVSIVSLNLDGVSVLIILSSFYCKVALRFQFIMILFTFSSYYATDDREMHLVDIFNFYK